MSNNELNLESLKSNIGKGITYTVGGDASIHLIAYEPYVIGHDSSYHGNVPFCVKDIAWLITEYSMIIYISVVNYLDSDGELCDIANTDQAINKLVAELPDADDIVIIAKGYAKVDILRGNKWTSINDYVQYENSDAKIYLNKAGKITRDRISLWLALDTIYRLSADTITDKFSELSELLSQRTGKPFFIEAKEKREKEAKEV